jgi:hypothetical protein
MPFIRFSGVAIAGPWKIRTGGTLETQHQLLATSPHFGGLALVHFIDLRDCCRATREAGRERKV